MTNAERLSFLKSEIDRLLSVKRQSRILLKKNDFEFVEKRAVVWLNKNPSGQVPVMEGFTFKLNSDRKVIAIFYGDIEVVDIESAKKEAA